MTVVPEFLTTILTAVLTTILSAGVVVTVLAFVSKTLFSGFFQKYIDIEVARATAAIEELSAARMETLKAELARAERLDSERLRLRGRSYGEIWALTGAANLFGQSSEVDQGALSAKLRDWYFKQGWLLSDHAKTHYFLVQETLDFAILRSIGLKRPGDEVLYASERSPVEVLRHIGQTTLRLPDLRSDKPTRYSLQDIRAAIVDWKKNPGDANGLTAGERAWVIFQLVMSSFRTRLTDELGSRQPTQA